MSEKIEKLLEEQNQSIRDLIGAVNKNSSILINIENYLIVNIRSQVWFSKLSKKMQLDIANKVKIMDES